MGKEYRNDNGYIVNMMNCDELWWLLRVFSRFQFRQKAALNAPRLHPCRSNSSLANICSQKGLLCATLSSVLILGWQCCQSQLLLLSPGVMLVTCDLSWWFSMEFYNPNMLWNHRCMVDRSVDGSIVAYLTSGDLWASTRSFWRRQLGIQVEGCDWFLNTTNIQSNYQFQEDISFNNGH